MHSPRSAKSNSSPAELVAVVNALRRIFRAIRLSSHEAETELGITGAQLLVLQQIAEHPNASLREVASLTLTDQSSVSVVVSRLVGRGLVVRKTSKADARCGELSVTTAGRTLLRGAPELAQGQLMKTLRSIDGTKLSATRHVLEQVVRDLGASDDEPQMFHEAPRR